jgi:hypothetical protein
MARLNQIIAVMKNVKGRVNRDVTDGYHKLQRTPQLTGISRTYRPRDEDGDALPGESTRVQVRADEVLRDIGVSLTHLFDLTLSLELTNTKAFATVSTDGIHLEGLPVTYLLFLEKQLVDVHTIVGKLPTLDPAEEWHHDDVTDSYATAVTSTVRSKKVPRNHVKAPATDKHPAQVEVYYEDVMAGTWDTVKYSGAVPASYVRAVQGRVETLLHAVKQARETANQTEVEDHRVGAAIFAHLFGGGSSYSQS